MNQTSPQRKKQKLFSVKMQLISRVYQCLFDVLGRASVGVSGLNEAKLNVELTVSQKLHQISGN
jgi:hypothetical protein